jgi:hypothetical protein
VADAAKGEPQPTHMVDMVTIRWKILYLEMNLYLISTNYLRRSW